MTRSRNTPASQSQYTQALRSLSEESLFWDLRARLQTSLWIVPIAILLSIVFDFFVRPSNIWIYFPLNAACFLLSLLSLRRLRIERKRTELIFLGLGNLTFGYLAVAFNTAMAGNISTLPLLSSLTTLFTGALLPWGIVSQLSAVAMSLAAITINTYLVTGSIAFSQGHHAPILFVTYAISVYLATELERQRKCRA